MAPQDATAGRHDDRPDSVRGAGRRGSTGQFSTGQGRPGRIRLDGTGEGQDKHDRDKWDGQGQAKPATQTEHAQYRQDIDKTGQERRTQIARVWVGVVARRCVICVEQSPVKSLICIWEPSPSDS